MYTKTLVCFLSLVINFYFNSNVGNAELYRYFFVISPSFETKIYNKLSYQFVK